MEWNGGVDYWSGVLDWTTGVPDRLKIESASNNLTFSLIQLNLLESVASVTGLQDNVNVCDSNNCIVIIFLFVNNRKLQ